MVFFWTVVTISPHNPETRASGNPLAKKQFTFAYKLRWSTKWLYQMSVGSPMVFDRYRNHHGSVVNSLPVRGPAQLPVPPTNHKDTSTESFRNKRPRREPSQVEFDSDVEIIGPFCTEGNGTCIANGYSYKQLLSKNPRVFLFLLFVTPCSFSINVLFVGVL